MVQKVRENNGAYGFNAETEAYSDCLGGTFGLAIQRVLDSRSQRRHNSGRCSRLRLSCTPHQSLIRKAPLQVR